MSIELGIGHLFWCAFDELMFCNDSIDMDNWDFVGALSKCDAKWSEESLEVFLRARKTYNDALHELGISVDEVMAVAMQATKAWKPAVPNGLPGQKMASSRL